MELTANQWVFEPFSVDGATVPVRARMRLRRIAQEQPHGDFEVAVRNAHFGVDASYDRERPDEVASMTDRARVLQQTRIHDPRWASDRMISGTVHVRVRIDREGRVVEALAEQVNLGRPDTSANMLRARNELAAAALKGVREWTYGIPTTGDQADRPYWDGRVTVNFSFGNSSYGEWRPCVPGPIQRADWAVDDMGAFGSPDVMAAGDGGSTHQVPH